MARLRWIVSLGVGSCLALACAGDREPVGQDTEASSGSAASSEPTAAEPTGPDGTSGGPTSSGTTGSPTTGPDPDSTGGDTTGEPPPAHWQPGVVYPTPEGPNARNLLDRRGLIHSHSPYSHDACDGRPMAPGGGPDPECLDDLRDGMCQTQHDFVMLTDHRESFETTPFPEVLLYDIARGDTLVVRDTESVANWAECARDVRPTLVMAGCESATMPVGLEHHAPGGGATYGDASPAAIEELRMAGAVTLVAHTEQWDPVELIDLPLDGFEMYNLHANLEANIFAGLQLLTMIMNDDPGLPHSDLVIFPLWQEDPRYLERWGTVLDAGVHRVTTMGTDSHRNTFPQELPDGERVDSFRRMMQWFSNHVLVRPDPGGDWDDRHVKTALLAGRVFGVFEYMGYAEGFDPVMEVGLLPYELGSAVPLAAAPRIVVDRPAVQNLDPAVTPPEITLHVMRAIAGGFEEVASEGGAQLVYEPDAPGAYRVEVRMRPYHLEPYLGDYADAAGDPRVWIYANPFYVEP